MTVTTSAPRRFGHLLPLALFVLALASGLNGPVTAQETLFASTKPLAPRDAFELSVELQPDGGRVLSWEIAEGYYLYRDHLAVETIEGDVVPLETAPGIAKHDPTFGSVEVYYHRAEATFSQAPGAVRVTYQGCQENGICYPPVTDTLPAVAPASADTEPAASSPATSPGSGPGKVTATDGLADNSTSRVQLAKDEGLVSDLMDRGGSALVLLGFFGFGLLLAFTPCVLPMIPILGGLLAGQGATLTARRGFALSGTYVVAMSSALALLGVAAALSGRNLQIALQSPWAIGGVAILFAALAMSMFGVFELRLPNAWNTRLSRTGTGRRGTFGGAAILGFTSALIMGPCVTAPLAGALLYIAQTGDTALGAAALFSLGLGEGVPLLLLGIFGARALPRAGRWMQTVNRIFGFIFLGMAVWLASRVVPAAAGLALWAGAMALLGVFLGGFDQLEATASPIARLRKAAGVSALFVATLLGFGAATGGNDPLRPLAGFRAASSAVPPEKEIAFSTIRSLTELDAALAKTEQPTLIYFTAEWCVSCRVIERRVWPDPGVETALVGMQLLAADLTEFDADGQALLDRLGSVGPPTMIFLDAEGREAPGTRLIGEPDPSAVVASARAVQ